MDPQIIILKQQLNKAYNVWLDVYDKTTRHHSEPSIFIDRRNDTEIYIELSTLTEVPGWDRVKSRADFKFFVITNDQAWGVVYNILEQVTLFSSKRWSKLFSMEEFVYVASYEKLRSALFDQWKEVRQLAHILLNEYTNRANKIRA